MAASVVGKDSKLVERARNEVSSAVVALVREEPFFGHLLAGTNRDFSERTPTAGVSFRGSRPLLTVNPEFFVKVLRRKEERVAVIKHEVLHLLFDHLGRIDFGVMDRRIYNLAADVVVNQFIGRKWILPEGAVTLDSFEFSLPPDETVEWYYRKLQAEFSRTAGGGAVGSLIVSADESGVLGNQASLAQGESGEGDSTGADANEGDDTDEGGSDNATSSGDGAVPTSSHSDHSEWVVPIDDTESQIGRQELAKLVRDAKVRSGSKFFSTVPEPVQQLVNVLLEELEPSIDWRRVLRQFSNSSRRTRVSNTLRRPSKRYGTYPGLKVKRFHRLAVVIDTSGSISEDALGEFFAEVHGMWRQGSEITVIEADERVQKVWDYKGNGAPQIIGGRGGTCFDPALQLVADEPKPFDAGIYLTDGHAATPTVAPRCKFLWVLTEGGSDSVLDGHRAIWMNR